MFTWSSGDKSEQGIRVVGVEVVLKPPPWVNPHPRSAKEGRGQNSGPGPGDWTRKRPERQGANQGCTAQGQLGVQETAPVAILPQAPRPPPCLFPCRSRLSPDRPARLPSSAERPSPAARLLRGQSAYSWPVGMLRGQRQSELGVTRPRALFQAAWPWARPLTSDPFIHLFSNKPMLGLPW